MAVSFPPESSLPNYNVKPKPYKTEDFTDVRAESSVSGKTETAGTSLFYRIDPSKWYGSFPFYFEIANGLRTTVSDRLETTDIFATVPTMLMGKRIEGTSEVKIGSFAEKLEDKTSFSGVKFFLPIPPKSITYQHIPASEATATLGGVVEETSAPVFHTITLVGTTGMSLRNSSGSGGVFSVTGRNTFSDISGRNNLAGRTINALENAVEGALDLLTPEVPLPFLRYGSAVSSRESELDTLSEYFVNEPISELWRSTVSAVMWPTPAEPSTYMNGYAWSIALKQFFMIYQREKAKNPSAALYFVDTKSNVRYRCVPRLVQFQKDASSPFTEQYNITLKCWNPEDASKNDTVLQADRFETDLKEVYTVNAAGIYRKIRTVMLKARRLSETGKSIAASALRDTTGSFFD